MSFSSFVKRKTVLWLFLSLGLAACSVVDSDISGNNLTNPTPTDSLNSFPDTSMTQEQSELLLPDLGPAPDFTNEVWLNSSQPLTLDRLQGKVVLVEFWTFG